MRRISPGLARTRAGGRARPRRTPAGVTALLRWSAWTPALLWAGVILVTSLVPGLGAPRGLGLLAHALAYMVLAWLVRRAVGPDGFVRGYLLPLCAAWGFGLVVEILQPGISGRSSETADLAANAVGAAAGLALPVRRRAGGRDC